VPNQLEFEYAPIPYLHSFVTQLFTAASRSSEYAIVRKNLSRNIGDDYRCFLQQSTSRLLRWIKQNNGLPADAKLSRL